jgi:hypothetical protein
MIEGYGARSGFIPQMDPDPGGPKHVDPMDLDPEHWFYLKLFLILNLTNAFFIKVYLRKHICITG